MKPDINFVPIHAHNTNPMSRETRESFWHGFETAIKACVLIIKAWNGHRKDELIASLRDLVNTEQERA